MNKFEKLYENVVNESSLSRIWQYIENPKKSFTVLSASRKTNTKKVNDKNYEELKTKIRKMGYGYVEQKGSYEEEDYGFVKEKSLFVPNMKKEDAIKLGIDYKQDSIIYKDNKEFSMIGTNKRMGIGKILATFEQGIGKKNFDFSKDTLNYVFSQLIKGNHRNKKFAFKMK